MLTVKKVTLVKCDRIGNFIKTITQYELSQINKGIIESLGITFEQAQSALNSISEESQKDDCIVPDNPEQLAAETAKLLIELSAVKAEGNVYKDLYNNLLEKMIKHG